LGCQAGLVGITAKVIFEYPLENTQVSLGSIVKNRSELSAEILADIIEFLPM
jgi:hypothetical protein